MNAIDQLCPQCGLCCDSTLFADVELRAGDDGARLKKSGLNLFRKAPGKMAFAQPCACFDGGLCAIYDGRPKRCRLFECGLLKRVTAGELRPQQALQKIAVARKKAGLVRDLLNLNGQADAAMPMSHRYQAAMNAPVDLAQADSSDNRGELMMAVNDLMQLLQKEFLSK